MNPLGVLSKAVSAPVLQAILQWIGLLKVTPLAIWQSNASVFTTVSYLVSAGAAAMASLCQPKTTGKVVLLLLGVLVLLASVWAYNWVSSSPPTSQTISYYEPLGYASFFATYASFGFLVGRVMDFFGGKSKKEEPTS
jgi:hypothetical protein